MRPEERLAAAVAESLHEASTEDFADRLAHWCVRALNADALAVTLAGPTDGAVLASATTPAAAEIERAELAGGVGPCVQALATGVPVLVDDVETAGRWPRLAALAGAAGYRAMYATPLRFRDATVGVLHLSYRSPEPGTAELTAADGIAEFAAAHLVRQRAAESLEAVASQLQTAMSSRIPIEQAKGVLAERLGVPVPEAFRVLRNYARRHNLLLDQVARAVAARGPEMAALDWAAELDRLRRK